MSTSGCIRSFAIYCSRVRPTCNPSYCVKGTGRPYLIVSKDKYKKIINININYNNNIIIKCVMSK
jgi:hypothetical protein